MSVNYQGRQSNRQGLKRKQNGVLENPELVDLLSQQMNYMVYQKNILVV